MKPAAISGALFLALSSTSALADCGASSRQADVTCFGASPDTAADSAPAINAAAREAVSQHVPLVIPAGRYRVGSTIDIDYAEAADTGIEVQANGAILDGAAAGVSPVLYIHCSGGSSQSPKGCFYFHLAGTLHVYANSGWGAVIGDLTLADAQNSIKIDHLDVNNAKGSGLLLGYLLNSDVFAVANAGTGAVALWLNQVQFSTIRGAAAAHQGWAIYSGDGYTFANTLQALDLEESDWCLVNLHDAVTHNTFVSPYFNCQNGLYSTAGSANLLLNPMFGGAVQQQGYFP
jgi:hypothetical protein